MKNNHIGRQAKLKYEMGKFNTITTIGPNWKIQNLKQIIMESRLQFLLRKNAGKRYFEKYQEELSKLIIDNDFKVLNLEDSDIISAAIIKNNKLFQQSNTTWTVRQKPFLEKNELRKVISHIQRKYNDIVYMSIKDSDMCGRVVLDKISSFNINFQYWDSIGGLIVFYDRSLTNSLVIDYYEEWNKYYYDLEIYGKEWYL